jgi:hypothetical protein
VPEAQDTFLSSNERGRQESRQSTHSWHRTIKCGQWQAESTSKPKW